MRRISIMYVVSRSERPCVPEVVTWPRDRLLKMMRRLLHPLLILLALLILAGGDWIAKGRRAM